MFFWKLKRKLLFKALLTTTLRSILVNNKCKKYVSNFPQNTSPSSAVIGAAVKATVIKIGNTVVALYGHEWPTYSHGAPAHNGPPSRYLHRRYVAA